MMMSPPAVAHAGTLNLFPCQLAIFMSPRPRSINADYQQIRRIEHRFQIVAEYTCVICIGRERARRQIEQRDVVIARDREQGRRF